MRAALVSVSALAFLVACDQGRVAETPPAKLSAATPPSPPTGEAAPPALMMRAPPAPPGSVPADPALTLAKPSTGAAMPILAPSLAYEYAYSLKLPGEQTRRALATHQSACEDAGPALCQVVSAESAAVGEKHARGRLELRAAPDWLRQFRGRLETDARTSGGKVVSVTTRTEDLTRSIIDTEAAIRSQLILQARLERLLAERTGNLEQALEVEQQVARVRAGIDAMRSSLEVMRARVAMSRLTIDYLPMVAEAAAPVAADSPPEQALKGVWNNLLVLIAGLITLASFLLPLGLLAAPAVWWLARRSRRAKAARAVRPPPMDLGA